MPTSSLLVIPTVVEHMEALRPRSILDVGPGYGKYAVIFREALSTHPKITGVEAWEPYVTQFRLKGIYDRIIVADVRALPDHELNAQDAVYLGDIIEHLTGTDAFVLLKRIQRPVVITTPEHFFHNPHGLPWTETHRSHWTQEDFESTGRVIRYDVIHGGQIVTLSAL